MRMLFQIKTNNKIYLVKIKTNLRFFLFYIMFLFEFEFEFSFAEIKVLDLKGALKHSELWEILCNVFSAFKVVKMKIIK